MLKTLETPGHPFKPVLRRIVRAARRSVVLKLVLALLGIFIVCGIAVYYVEHQAGGGIISIGEAFWWLIAVVTKAPGYTGVFPLTVAGRVIAFLLIVVGLSFIPLVTAKIASYMVTRRLREERGLEKIRAKNHTVICGWNEHLDTVLEGVLARHSDGEIVLLNSLGMEKMNEMLVRYKDSSVKYVHGDFTSEAILDLANIRQAGAVMVLADSTQGDAYGSADEKVVLATLAVKTANPKAWVCVEVMEPRTAMHARRAGANEVITHGEHDPFLIVSAATAEGVVLATRELLSYQEGNTLQQKAIPPDFAGRKFAELAAHFAEKHDAILIGLYDAGKSLRAEDVLGADYSMIDAFIERKFKEAGKEYLSTSMEVPRLNLNPEDDYVVRPNQVAIVISR